MRDTAEVGDTADDEDFLSCVEMQKPQGRGLILVGMRRAEGLSGGCLATRIWGTPGVRVLWKQGAFTLQRGAGRGWAHSSHEKNFCDGVMKMGHKNREPPDKGKTARCRISYDGQGRAGAVGAKPQLDTRRDS